MTEILLVEIFENHPNLQEQFIIQNAILYGLE